MLLLLFAGEGYRLVRVVSQACSPPSATTSVPPEPEHDAEDEPDEHEQLTWRRRATIDLPKIYRKCIVYSVDKLRHCSGCLCSWCCSVPKHVHEQVWKTCAEMCEPCSCRRHLFSCIIHQSYIRFIVPVKLSIQ